MTRATALRRAFGAAVAVLGVFAVACAEKTLEPSVAASPRFTIQVTMTAKRTAAAQKVFVVAGYFRPPLPGDQPGDSAHLFDAALQDITGGPQQVNLKVDLTTCLADPTRHGSHDACTMFIAAWLQPSTWDPDTSNSFFGAEYDFEIVGPFDASPGHPPAPQAMDLSTSHFAVNHWETDESLRLGGSLAPVGLSGPITGAISGTGAPTLFALTEGQDPTSKPDSTFNGPQLAVFQNGAWRRVLGKPGSFNGFDLPYSDVAAFSPTDVWLSTYDGSIGLYHYDGTAITAVSGARDVMRSVAVTPASAPAKYVIAGTNNGGVWVGNGTTFTKYSLPGFTLVENVCINSATEAFASSRANGSTIYRFDGTNWISVPTANSGGKSDLQCLGAGQAYVAVGGTLNRWNGSGWTALAGPASAGRSMSWAVVSPSEIYAVGDSASTNRAFYRFDGTSWKEVGRLTFTGQSGSRIWADPRGGAAYVGSVFQGGAARIEAITPTSASVLTYNPLLRDVAMPTTTSAFVVGANFFLARWNGARWTVDAPPAGTRTNRALNGVWASDPANVWAVGQYSTIVRWDGTRWNVSSDSIRPIGFSIDNYNAVWGTGGSTWIVGDASIVRCSAPTSCGQDSPPAGGALYGVWGTSAANIYAVGAGGRILHYNGTAWTSMSSPTRGRLSRVSGSGANDIWAAGDTVLLHFDGSAWKAVTSSISDGVIFPLYQAPAGIFPTALWAASAREVYYGTWFGQIYRGGNLGWGQNPFAFQGNTGVLSIAGPPGGCALGVADPNRSYTNGSPNLLRGVGPSGCLSVPMTAPASWP